MIITNKLSSHTQEISKEDWDKIKDKQISGQKPGVTWKTAFTIKDASSLTSPSGANVPEKLKVHTSTASPEVKEIPDKQNDKNKNTMRGRTVGSSSGS